MPHNLFLRYTLSPLVTLVLLIGLEYGARRHGLTVSMALPVGALALCLFWSGFRANIMSAIFITAYAFYNFNNDLSRFAQLVLTVWPVAVGGGLLKRWLVQAVAEVERYRVEAELATADAERNREKAEMLDALNGNIANLKKWHKRLLDLDRGWNVLKPAVQQEIVQEVGNGLGNLLQSTEGWRQFEQWQKGLEEGAKDE